MRILIVQETNWLDRNVIHQHHLAERLVKRGHTVQVIDYDILWSDRKDHHLWQPRQVFSNVNKVVEGAALDVIRPATLQLPLLCHLSWTASSLNEIKRLVTADKPDVVVGLTLSNSYPMALLLKSMGIPYLSVVLEPYFSMVPQRWAQPFAKIVENLALRSAGHVLVFTPQMQRYVQNMSAHPQKVSLFKTGVSLDIFHPGMNGSSQREALGIEQEEWVLFFMGWLYEFSGLREIVSYLCENPKILDNARFLIVGNGDLYDELVELTHNSGLDHKILLTGRRPYSEIPGLLASADVCLLPALDNDITREIVTMKTYEYLAAGKPVVATALQGVQAEFGTDGGIVFAEDPIDVLHKALSLRDYPEQVINLSLAGRRTAEENADWEKTTDRFEHLLENMTARNGRNG